MNNNNTDNTDTTVTAPAPEAQNDLPALELESFFKTLDLHSEISGVHAAIDSDTDVDGKGWPHVAMTVTFTRTDGDNGSGTPRRASVTFSTPYKMGVGLADWGKMIKTLSFHRSSADYRDVELMAKSSLRLTPESQRNICAKHLSAFIRKVSPAQVLAYACRDGLDASGQSFESWASEYGYDTDSRKAEDTYRECQRLGDGARRLLSHAPGAVEKLAELVSRL